MVRALLFTIIGYICGSFLFARYFGYFFAQKDVTSGSSDGNPGTFNAFRNGGFLCGTATLIADLLKGFLPVFFYSRTGEILPAFGLMFVLVAPVVGHAFPLFHKFCGGKGVAVSFGCLLGLLPNIYPAAVLAFLFIFLSLVVKITPHYYRTLFTYIFFAFIMLFTTDLYVWPGFVMIASVVILKLILSGEEKSKLRVGIGWKS